MTRVQGQVSLKFGPYKRQLRDCPQPFIEWLLSSCQSPPAIKHCNFLITAGSFSKRRISSLSRDELKQFVLDDSQGIWQHQIAKEKLARLEESQLIDERNQRISVKVAGTRPKKTAADLGMFLPTVGNVVKSVRIGGAVVRLYELTTSELRTLWEREASSSKKTAIGTAIRFKNFYGENWQPTKK